MSQSGSSVRTVQPLPPSSDGNSGQVNGAAPAGETLPAEDDQPTIISRHPPLPPVAISDSVHRILQGKIMPGDRLGHFDLVQYIGGGGMGRVFRGLDIRLARQVAVKILAPEHADDEETRLRFQNEAQSAARLDHENIARVFYVGEDRGLHYIVFEYIEGINIRTLVEQRGPLPLGEAVGYTLQVAQALTHAAERAVVHRDIKPSNVLITPEGHVKLIDMGLARLKQIDPAAADLTASGVTLGTFDYISPEQARDPRIADVRSDIYSLGCTFFYMLAGRPPFPEGTVLQKLLQHQGDQPPDVRQFRPDLPEEADRVLRRMLAKDPRHRYRTPAELVEDLLRLASQIGLQPVMPGQAIWVSPRPPRFALLQRHLPWIAPVATLVCIVLLLHFLWRDERPPAPPPGGLGVAEPADKSVPGKSGRGGPDGGVGRRKSPPERTVEKPPAKPEATAGTPASRVSEQPLGAAERGAIAPEKPFGVPAADGPAIDAIMTGAWQRWLAGSDTGEMLTVEALRRSLSAGGGYGSGLGSGFGPAPSRLPGLSGGMIDPPTGAGGMATLKRPGVLVVDGATAGENQFSTLAAACGAAVSGDVIELRFDGPREEKPLRLSNVQVTIRAGEGYRPTIVIRAAEQGPASHSRAMLNLSGGRLELLNVALEFHPPRELPAEDWAMCELRGSPTVRLEKCSLTIRNASDQAGAYHEDVAFFRTRAAPGGDAVRSETTAAGISQASLELVDCVVRGEAILLCTEDLQPVQLSWDNGLLVTTERLLATSAGPDLPKSGALLRLDLRHLTAVTRGGLLHLAGTPTAPHQLPVQIRCSNSILLGTADRPLVEQEGTHDFDLLREQFDWRGDRNFYEGFEVFWRIDDANRDSPPQMLDFAAWCAHWSSQRENLPCRAGVVWKKLPELTRPVHAHTIDDYALSDLSFRNAALGAASDGRNVGMLVDRLPPLPPSEVSAAPSPKKPLVEDQSPAEKPPSETADESL